MSFLDIRTVMFNQLITDAVCTAVLIFLWLQSRKRLAGMFFWVVDFIFQTTAALLIILRGSIPDWISLGFTSLLVIGGALMGYLGLQRFVGKRNSQVYNYILLGVFILIHFYFVFVRPNLAARDLNVSLGLLVFCAQCAWLLLRHTSREMSRMTRPVGWVFTVFCLVSLLRIIIILASPNPSNDFFQSGLYDTLILMSYQFLLILLTFSLVLMFIRRLLVEMRTQEEKFTKVFQSSPYAILITRLSDGLILDVNHTFEKLSGYPHSEAVGKSSLDLHLWAIETDRQEIIAELSAGGKVQGREFQFRMKSGEQRTGLYYAEIVVIGNERLILSSLSDITERKQAEETIRSLSRFPAEDPNPVLRIARDGNLLYANEAAIVQLADWKLEAGRPAPEVLKDPTSEVFGTQTAKTIEIPCGERTFSVAIALAPENDYTNLYGLDVTERKQAEEEVRQSEEQYRTLFTTMMEGFCVIEVLFDNDDCPIDYRFLEINSAFEAQTGLRDAKGRLMRELAPEHEQHWFDIYGKVAKTGESTHFVNEAKALNRWYDVSAYRVGGQDSRKVGIFFNDITNIKRSEEELRQSQENFAKAFISSPTALAITRRSDGQFLDLNAAYTRVMGYEPVEILGRTTTEMQIYFHPDERNHLIQQISEQGTVRDYELLVNTKSGEVRNLLVSMEPILYDKEPSIISTFIDITERKRTEDALRESENNFRALAENAGEGILIAGEGGIHRFANRASTEITGYSVDELLYLNARALAHPDEAPKVMERLQKRLAGENIPNRYETAIVSKQGLKIPVEISSNPTIWKGQPADIVFIIDITPRKLAQEELQRTLEELKRSNADLEQFAYVASHDLQEPLRMVSSYMQLLERRYKGNLDKDADEFIGFAVDGAERMQRLINDLLAYSRVGRRGKPFASISCEASLVQALDNLKVAIHENKAKITHNPLPEVVADEAQLVELFQNLIGNAVKFHGDQAPRIHVSVEAREKELVFSVRDNGIGIDPQYAERIFVIFQRLHNREQYAGTGIGLALCKKIVQRHGGRIWVESHPGQGATFFFTLPKKEVNGHGDKI